MAKKISILVFGGSLRKGSYNKALLHTALEMVPADAQMEAFDIAAIPSFNQDLEKEPAPVVKEFKAKIKAADAILIVTPEYNYSIPGVLKNAIDWASRPPETSPLSSKPLAIMGAGGMMGTSRAQYHLRQVAVFTNMVPMNKPELFVRRAAEKFDDDGNPRDPMLRYRVRNLIEALLAWTERLQRCP